MLLDKRPYTIDRVVRIAIVFGIIFGTIKLLGFLSDVLVPFFIALLLAYIINPFVLWIEKMIKNHALSVFISLFISIGGIVLLGYILVPIVIDEVSYMGDLLGNIVSDSDLQKQAQEKIPPQVWQHIDDFIQKEEVQAFFSSDKFMELLQKVYENVVPGLKNILSGTISMISGIIGLAIVLLYLIFLLVDFKRIDAGWRELIPEQYRAVVLGFIADFDKAMHTYFRAQALVALLVGVLFAIGFGIIGLPMGIALGLFIGLLNMVPYLQLIGIIPTIFFAIMKTLETGMDFWLILALVGLVFVVVQIIQETILVPKIMGNITGLSPAVILLSLSVWGKLLGVLGLLIALPVTCMLFAYYQRFVLKKRKEEVEMIGQQKIKKTNNEQ